MFIAITLHLLAAIIWVGGMFFAYMVLRPSAAKLLEPPQRLTLWHDCFERFFAWVWACVILLPATGYWMVFDLYGGFSHSGWHIEIMQITGLIMIGLYVYLYASPYRALKKRLSNADYLAAGQSLAAIRTIVGANLIIGMTTAMVAVAGRFI